MLHVSFHPLSTWGPTIALSAKEPVSGEDVYYIPCLFNSRVGPWPADLRVQHSQEALWPLTWCTALSSLFLTPSSQDCAQFSLGCTPEEVCSTVFFLGFFFSPEEIHHWILKPWAVISEAVASSIHWDLKARMKLPNKWTSLEGCLELCFTLHCVLLRGCTAIILHGRCYLLLRLWTPVSVLKLKQRHLLKY